MTIEEKQENLSKLRDAFIAFMNTAMSLTGTNHGKQLACIRFDEGHMWMQNAIMTYQEPAAE